MNSDLISRLEAATGPGRELDAEIAGTETATVHWHDDEETPRYTTSIDAALTLKKPGQFLDRLTECNTDGLCEARICGTDGTCFIGVAKTPALAICIAALRAQGGV